MKSNGTVGHVDLDAAVDVVRGPSGRRPSWEALVIFDPKEDVLIELRDSPQDCAHGTPSEAEEVDDAYVHKHFGVSTEGMAELRRHPKLWQLIVNKRRGA